MKPLHRHIAAALLLLCALALGSRRHCVASWRQSGDPLVELEVRAGQGGCLSPAIEYGLGGSLDVERAKAEDLELLPGIGPRRAEAIVDLRNAQGPLGSIETLQKAKGIGPKTIDGLRGHARLGEPR